MTMLRKYCLRGSIALVIASAAPLAAQQPAAQDWANLQRFRQANAELGAVRSGERRVVFMGNSITEQWSKVFPSMFHGKPYINRGISGQTTPQMLARFRQDVVALSPAIVVILAGTNDIAGNTGPSSLEMIQDNLMSMTEIAQANGIRVVLSSVLPAFEYPWKPGLEPAPKIVALNTWIKDYAGRVGAAYVDYHSAMRDERDGLRAEFTTDGVHVTEAGYRVMAGLVEPAIGHVGQAQTPTGWTDFKDAFRTFVAIDAIVGASALLMRDGRVLERVDLGFSDRTRGIRVDSSTIFHWASITKTLTGIAIMQLLERGRLRLDDRVVDYIPELRRIHDPFGSRDSITIRMLLNHTSGFRGGTWPYSEGKAWQPFEPASWEQLVAMMPYQELQFAPGSRYGYSNPAFVYLARIIEQLTGDAWESYVQKNIFAPLGLERSYFRSTPYHLAASRSHNYSVERDSATRALRVIDHGADFDTGITTPNGGWNAPLGDLARYVRFLTSRADGIVKRSTLEQMWQPGKPMSQGYQSAPQQWMGLSFMIHGTGDRRVLGHTGHQANFGSFFFFNPRTKMAIIVAYNTTNYDSVAPRADLEAKVQRAAVDLLR